MWKKYFIYFLLLNLLNTAFFTAENLDDHPYDGIVEVGQEEINSLIEYIYEDFLGFTDSTPEDEDDDDPDNAKIYQLTQNISSYYLFKKNSPFEIKVTYSKFYLAKENTFPLEVTSPPPKI